MKRNCGCTEEHINCRCSISPLSGEEADEKFGITEMVNRAYENAETKRTGLPAIDNPKAEAADVIRDFQKLLEDEDE